MIDTDQHHPGIELVQPPERRGVIKPALQPVPAGDHGGQRPATSTNERWSPTPTFVVGVRPTEPAWQRI
jgi:hypothetical protein